MARHVIARDEQGFSWIVFPEDVGWKLIRQLPNTMTSYALPRKSLLTGEITDYSRPFFYDQELENISPELADVIFLQDRIYKTVEYLKRRDK